MMIAYTGMTHAAALYGPTINTKMEKKGELSLLKDWKHFTVIPGPPYTANKVNDGQLSLGLLKKKGRTNMTLTPSTQREKCA